MVQVQIIHIFTITITLLLTSYVFIFSDDCWAEQNRDAQGNLVAKASKFPSGIKALADYVHGKGLKLGIYSDAGYIHIYFIHIRKNEDNSRQLFLYIMVAGIRHAASKCLDHWDMKYKMQKLLPHG